MHRQGPRYRGGHPGAYGDGTNRLSDAEDSVIVRKKNLRRQQQKRSDRTDRDPDYESTDDVGGRGEACYSDDDDIGGHPMPHLRGNGMDPGRYSARDGSQGRRGVRDHGMNRPADEMDLYGHRSRTGGRRPDFMDKMTDSMEGVPGPSRGRTGGRRPDFMDDMFGGAKDPNPHGGRAGGRVPDDEYTSLQRQRAMKIEEIKHDRSDRGRKYLERELDLITEDLARLEYEQRESGGKSRGMRAPTGGRGSIAGPSRAADKHPQETGGEFYNDGPNGRPLEKSDLPWLKKSRDAMLKTMNQVAPPRSDFQLDMIALQIDTMTEDITRLEFGDREGSKMIRAWREAESTRDRETYSDEFDFQPQGRRRGHHRSAGGPRGFHGR